MNAQEIKSALLSQLESVITHLYPNAALKGNNYELGDLQGNPGSSLRISVNGAKRGVWSDFAAGGGGDILSLFMEAKGYSNYKEAAPALHEYLGARMGEAPAPKRSYKAPVNDTKSSQRAIDYLKGRGISDKVIADFQIAGSSRDDAIAFKYFDEDGKLQMIKYLPYARREDGKKEPRTTTESKKILYGMHTHLVRSSKGILGIAEGEVDCMSWQMHGYPFVSVPFGAKEEANQEWLDNCYEWLEQFHTIYVSMDMDVEGQKAAAWLMKHLGHERTYLVSLPYKDANDALKGGVNLSECITRAKAIDPDGIKLASNLSKEVWASMHKGRREDQGLPFLGWDPEDFGFRLRPAEGTLITGFPNHGKSNLCYQLMSWLASVQRERVFIGSYEEKAHQILMIMVAHALGHWPTTSEYPLFKKAEELMLNNVIIHDYVGSVPYREFFSHASYACRRYGVRWALLDSITKTDVNLEDDKSVKDFCDAAQKFWEETGVHLFCIAHPRKPPNERFMRIPTYHDIKGANYFGACFFNSITSYRENDTSLIQVNKHKVSSKLPQSQLYYNADSLRVSIYTKDNEPYL